MATTSLNPGVGPTNADIATAVAAPSAATIASAVAAPSSATIATAVAAAVPTLTQINNSVATNAPSPNAWVHLGTHSLNNNSGGTVSFSAYRKLRIIFNANQGSNSDELWLRLNSDSNANYGWTRGYLEYNNYFSSNSADTQIRITNGNISANQFTVATIEIDNASLTNVKLVKWRVFYNASNVGTPVVQEGDAVYRGTSPITSVYMFNAGNQPFQANDRFFFQVFGMN
jgi:hypothetical protein